MLGISQEHRAETIVKKGSAICVRALLQNWRQGTVACKGRSDVAFQIKSRGSKKVQAELVLDLLVRHYGVLVVLFLVHNHE